METIGASIAREFFGSGPSGNDPPDARETELLASERLRLAALLDRRMTSRIFGESIARELERALATATGTGPGGRPWTVDECAFVEEQVAPHAGRVVLSLIDRRAPEWIEDALIDLHENYTDSPGEHSLDSLRAKARSILMHYARRAPPVPPERIEAAAEACALYVRRCLERRECPVPYDVEFARLIAGALEERP